METPWLLEQIYRLQEQAAAAGESEQDRLLLKMFANILEGRYEVAEPKNLMDVDEYLKVPGRWELIDGFLYYD